MMSSVSTVFARLRTLEKAALGAVLGVGLVLGVGSLVLPELIWDGFLDPYVWEPVVGDATAGDTGYNVTNTALFAILLFTFVIAISGMLRIADLPARPATILALVPWVVLASVLRVLEDADLFADGPDRLLISPLIHFFIAAWVVGSGLLASLATRGMDSVEDDEVFERMIYRIRFCSTLMLLLFYMVLFEPSLSGHGEISWFTVPIGAVLAVLVCWFAPAAPDLSWKPVERMLFSTGIALSVVGLGFWLQFAVEPWAAAGSQELWPVLVAIGLPSLVIFVMYSKGIGAQMELESMQIEPGVLAEDWTMDEWEDHESEEKDRIESLTGRAMLASPLTLTFTFGQLCDGLATWIGVDFGNYSEKHVLGSKIMEWGSSLMDGDGAWLFLLVKIALTSLLVLVFAKTRVEHHQRHLRLLIVLALLAVGMAPGIRNLGRNILGV